MSEELQNEENEIEIISLKDEEGNDHDFEILDELEYEGQKYCALLPYYENPDDLDSKTEEDTEILILHIYEEDGDEICESIADEDLFDKISALFDERIEKMYETQE
ncbi:MAG: DUF1292 domain-containing protein [Bacteroidales bacterium]|jgi:uncharacterized protein YrzB (UPF0473 family)|nr:DUF1292 domain-containing protein [Bacteroidales bacterium]MBQ5404574.1 DUF1292 domain-containing protein [Bacteroidales bacterium]MBR6278336.1 DUF1292 domain-containing protein [Bacteroidales bacterium]